MTHDNHPHGCSPYERPTTYGDNFGLAGCTTEEVREEELPRVRAAGLHTTYGESGRDTTGRRTWLLGALDR